MGFLKVVLASSFPLGQSAPQMIIYIQFKSQMKGVKQDSVRVVHAESKKSSCFVPPLVHMLHIYVTSRCRGASLIEEPDDLIG